MSPLMKIGRVVFLKSLPACCCSPGNRREANVFAETESTIEPHFELEDETQSALAAAVDSLPHDQREVLVLKIWNELTFAEIASTLGISQNTAASRYRYALAGLRKSLQPR